MNKKYNKQKELTQFLTADDFTSHLWAEVKSNSNTENLMYMLFLKALNNPRVVKVLEEICKETGGIIVTDATDRENRIRSITKKHFDTIIKEVSVILDEYNELALRMNCEKKLEADEVEETKHVETLTVDTNNLLTTLISKFVSKTESLSRTDKAFGELVTEQGSETFLSNAISFAKDTGYLDNYLANNLKDLDKDVDLDNLLDQIVENILRNFVTQLHALSKTDVETTVVTSKESVNFTSLPVFRHNNVMDVIRERTMMFGG